MKYILTTENDVIINISDTLDYQSNGNPLVNNGTLAIAKPLVKEIFEYTEEIPSKITPDKYCYTVERGFYKNPNFKQYYSIEDRVSVLEDMVNMLLIGEEEEEE